MSEKRIVVVGAGIVGLCVAWHLANRGLKPLVLQAAAKIRPPKG